MAELRTEALGKSFAGVAVLRDVGFTVPAGGLLAILGASGGGKTTLLRLLCGFERADAGRIWVGGELVSGPRLHMPPERRRIGYVAQDGALFPHLSVADNVLFGLPRAARRDRRAAGALLERVGLPAAFAARAPQELSGGEQQRVALARALAPGPALVLLDEPFSALDAALRQETRAAVAAALRAAGATAILVTHDQAEALSLGERVAVLRGGVLVQVDTPQMLYRRPVDAALARFVGDAVLLPGEADGMVARCALGTLALAAPAHGAVQVLVRPEQVLLLPSEAGGPTARVEDTSFEGHDATVTLRLADGLAIAARVAGHAMPPRAADVALRVEGAVVAYR